MEYLFKAFLFLLYLFSIFSVMIISNLSLIDSIFDICGLLIMNKLHNSLIKIFGFIFK